MGSLIALLPAAFNLLKVLLPVIGVVGGLWYTNHLSSSLSASRAEAQQATAVAQANAKAVEQYQAQQQAADIQMKAMIRVAEVRLARYNDLRRKVLNATNTSACAASPPIRALLDGLRQEPPPGAEGAIHF